MSSARASCPWALPIASGCLFAYKASPTHLLQGQVSPQGSGPSCDRPRDAGQGRPQGVAWAALQGPVLRGASACFNALLLLYWDSPIFNKGPQIFICQLAPPVDLVLVLTESADSRDRFSCLATSLVAQMVKNLPPSRRLGFNPQVRKIPWRREWLPISVLLPGESHGQRSPAVYSPWGHRESDRNEQLTLWLFIFFHHLLPVWFWTSLFTLCDLQFLHLWRRNSNRTLWTGSGSLDISYIT